MDNLINGILSTPMTPFTEEGNLALDLIEPFVAWQAENGVRGFYILGTWGGFALLSIDERKKVAEAYSKAVQKYNLQLMIHVGSHSWEDTIMLGKHAIEIGATAISSTVPGYYSTGGYLTLEDYRRYFGGLVNCLRAPIYVYNNPRTTNVLLEPDEFVNLVKEGIAGVKDGSKNIAWLVKTQNYLKEQRLVAEIIPGNTVGILYGFIYGCTAVTSGTSVVFPKETIKVLELLNEDNYTNAALQHRLVLKLRESLNLCSAAPSSAHYLLNKIGPSLGYNRSIWPTVDKEMGQELVSKIKEINLKYSI